MPRPSTAPPVRRRLTSLAGSVLDRAIASVIRCPWSAHVGLVDQALMGSGPIACSPHSTPAGGPGVAPGLGLGLGGGDGGDARPCDPAAP